MPDIREALTRKVGPLPVWAWGAVVGGGVLVARALTGGGGGASVQPVSLNSGAEPATGGAGGAGDGANPLGYITLPDGSVVLDKPADAVTVLPGGGIAPTSPSTGGGGTPATTSLWGSDVPSVISTRFSSASAASILRKYGINFGSRINLTDLAALFRKRGINYGTTINPVDVQRLGIKPGTGDTTYDAEGDTSAVPVVLIPAMPPRPIGNVIALPVYDMPDIYRGPTFSRDIIAGGALVSMPPVSGSGWGSVNVPRLPRASGEHPTTSPRRVLDGPRRIIDGLTPATPPTTYRPRLRLASGIRTRLDTITGANVSG